MKKNISLRNCNFGHPIVCLACLGLAGHVDVGRDC
jgi:hypothetical protein